MFIKDSNKNEGMRFSREKILYYCLSLFGPPTISLQNEGRISNLLIKFIFDIYVYLKQQNCTIIDQ